LIAINAIGVDANVLAIVRSCSCAAAATAAIDLAQCMSRPVER
jgi:hypothetical protein